MAPSCPLTVVICTRDRPDALRDVVSDALAQAPAGAELVVVDQSDDTASTAAWMTSRADGRLRYEVDPDRGLPSARNKALALANGRIVVFLDDDARLHAGCLAAHFAAFDDPTVGAVVGRVVERVVRPNAAPGVCRIDLGGRARSNLDGGTATDVESLKGANMSVRRLALTGVGGFDVAYDGTAFLEEADLAARLRAAGWRLRFVPEAAVEHLSLPSGGCRVESAAASELSRFRNTGRWVARNRPWSAGGVLLTFGAVAAKRAVEWRDPIQAPRLVAALLRGLSG